MHDTKTKANHSGRVNPRSSGYEAKSSRDDLLNMLECPICLETADTPPIYQCSEGHLLCKVKIDFDKYKYVIYSLQDCNAKMKECPQCRHTLLNARNRTAESLAQVLSNLQSKGGEKTSRVHNAEVTVSHPQEVKKRFSSYVQYRYQLKIQKSLSFITILKG